MKQTFLLFELYHKIEAERVMEVFKHFPYLFCCDTHKMRLFMAQFRKYRFTQDQIINVCAHSGGLLACKVSNLTGLFDYMKLSHKIKASEVIRILDTYPEFALQNRHASTLLLRKLRMIRRHSPSRNDTYIRNLIRRHPDLFLKSFASMEAKIFYITRTLNRQLYNEKCFPLILHFNYSTHIWPRCELLNQTGNKHFDLEGALLGTDEEFC